MTRERSEEVVLLALVVSVAVHIGLMVLVKPQVMTTTLSTATRNDRRPPMRVVRSEAAPEPAKIEELLDLAAAKDAPPAVGDASAPLAAAPTASAVLPEAPKADSAKPAEPMPEVRPILDTRPVDVKPGSIAAIPMGRIETPRMSAAADATPDFSVRIPAAAPKAMPAVASPGRDAASVFLPPKSEVKMTRRSEEAGEDSAKDEEKEKIKFTPAKEVYEKVEEKIVTEEKKAVRELVNAEDAVDLVKFVNVTMKSASANGWRYFKVMMTPRSDLKTVPKDVVMVIDGSGSIGNDRFGNCRKAARRILRSCTNTGDRFNLVVFRNAFSYAFRDWRECDAPSFEAGDKWLSKQTAHGRTDVFSTISSVLTLPRDPKRPLVALVVTDGDANMGVSDTAEILSKFTALNDGLVSVYMYGVKSSANRELIDVLTHGNRGEGFVFEGWRWNAGDGMEELSERFRDPVLSDLRVVFSAGTRAEAYPRLLRNICRGGTLGFVGRVPADTAEVAFSLKGINGADAYEGFFKLPLATAPDDPSIVAEWDAERAIDRKLGTR